MDQNKINSYVSMQLKQYNTDASNWNINNRDPVVGSFDKHNNWSDYEYLFEHIPKSEMKNYNVLDFGCGPGRNIVKYSIRFNTIDGVDISKINLDKAKIWINHNLVKNNANLYQCNGYNLNNIPDDTYDLVMSTIAMQHICVHSIRFNYLKEFYRVLKKNGHITIQMGYGSNPRKTVAYFDNYTEATVTNSGCDVRIDNVVDLKTDLDKIGFTDFAYTIGPTGPGDYHQNWIYFSAKK